MTDTTPGAAAALGEADRELIARIRARAGEGRPVPLLQLLEVKRALKALFPLEEAFARYRAIMDLGPNVALRAQRLAPFSALCARHAETVHVLHEGGGEAVLHPPRTIGQAITRTIRGPTRRVELAAFRDASAFSRTSTVRLKNGTFVFDFQAGEVDSLPVDSAFDPVVFHREGESVHVIDDRRRMSAITLPEAISLMGIDTMSFGHWMVEEFLKFLSVRTAIDIAGIPILIDAAMPRQHRQSILAFTGPGHPVIEVPRGMRVEAGRLWVMNNWLYSPKILTTDIGIDPNALVMPTKPMTAIYSAAFDELARRHGLPRNACPQTAPGEAGPSGTGMSGTGPSGTGPAEARPEPGASRIFLARDATRHRAIANHEAVAALLTAHGFVETRPETLSFLDQFRLYRCAEEIVGQTGSATLGLLMCRPGTRAVLLSHAAMPLQALLAQLLRDLGVDFLALVGETVAANTVYADKSTYTIDEAALGSLLASRLKGPL